MSFHRPALFIAALLGCAAPALAQNRASPAMAQLRAQLETHARATGGVVGLRAVHLETGETVALRATERFFMSSVTKLPLAVAVLRRVDRGEIRLGDTVSIPVSGMSRGPSPIRDRNPNGARMTVEALVRSAVSVSDNTANDALQRLMGGPSAVTAELARGGIRGVRVDRPYTRLTRELSPNRLRGDDPRDTMTPDGAVALLRAIWAGPLLSPASRERLVGYMTRSENPANRIVAGVPAGTPVAHKTGTWGGDAGIGAINDIGIITLPDGKGHVLLTIFVRNPSGQTAQVAPHMAAMARTVYEHWARR
ncbi:MAG TPA: class A beta-lactamase [Longimicrobium sp.]|jgi:beta-lactamase class A